MKIVVHGLWHLGTVTAACLAEAGFSVTGLDDKAEVIADLRVGKPPLFEPGLAELVAAGQGSGRLSWSADPKVVADADVVWVAFDTPVDDEDRADTVYVTERVAALFPHLKKNALVLISSQLPVGSTRALAKRCVEAGRGDVAFAYSPENLRLGKALDVFRHPERIIIGADDGPARDMLKALLGKFCGTLIFMSVESAEMVKHALNAFLATSVTFINEVATICEKVGADASEVEEGLRSEPRIGRKAYMRPGAAFAGGTLARDVTFLGEIAAAKSVATPMLAGIIPSNANHRQWPLNRVLERVGDVKGKTVAILGLSYKPGTDAIRRSASIELCRDLLARGAKLQVFDPAVRSLPADLPATMAASLSEALAGAEAVVIATEWPEFRELTPDIAAKQMRKPVVIDQNRFLPSVFASDARIAYLTIGRPA